MQFHKIKLCRYNSYIICIRLIIFILMNYLKQSIGIKKERFYGFHFLIFSLSDLLSQPSLISSFACCPEIFLFFIMSKKSDKSAFLTTSMTIVSFSFKCLSSTNLLGTTTAIEFPHFFNLTSTAIMIHMSH